MFGKAKGCVWVGLSRVGTALLFLGWLSGCASYEAHYSKFQGVNSSGEERSFLLSWQTKRYPSWSLGEDESTPVRLQTQCSEREWLIRDKHTDVCEANERLADPTALASIRACGIPGKDLDRQGRPITEPGYQCMGLSDAQGADTILGLGREVRLTVSCFPDQTVRQSEDGAVGTDYLKPSVIPYNLPIRTVPLYSIREKLPELDDKVCPEDP
ncbi:MAG: hypothetical protein CL583_08065 [Alteromonadaceae bacterium]|nr:hypothetical protein [Alteromonadaceae bacterium]